MKSRVQNTCGLEPVFGHQAELAEAASVLAIPTVEPSFEYSYVHVRACDVRSKLLPHPTALQIEYCECGSKFNQTSRMGPVEQQFPISARPSAVLQAEHASHHPGYFLQYYSFHSLDSEFRGWTKRSNSTFSRSSSVSRTRLRDACRTTTIGDGTGKNCSKVNNPKRRNHRLIEA